MRDSIIALAVLMLWPVAGAAACPGDLNGDGTVTINEIITAVNAALNGCAADPCPGDLNGDQVVTVDEIIKAVNAALQGCEPTPTPSPTPTPRIDSCPYTFADDTLTLGASCGYSGPFSMNPTCSTSLSALLLGDGNLVAISVGSDPIITFGGIPTSPTAAMIVAYFVGDDLTPQPLSGVIQLADDGKTLVIDPDTVPAFNIGGIDCSFDRYAGTFTQVVTGSARRATRRQARFDVLRALSAQRAAAPTS
jgi:hypothetical protein